jgi:hypothetical protein
MRRPGKIRCEAWRGTKQRNDLDEDEHHGQIASDDVVVFNFPPTKMY